MRTGSCRTILLNLMVSVNIDGLVACISFRDAGFLKKIVTNHFLSRLYSRRFSFCGVIHLSIMHCKVTGKTYKSSF